MWLQSLRIAIHTRDHLPAHVHVIGPDAEAVFELTIAGCICTRSHGFSGQDLARIKAFLDENVSTLFLAWESIHGKED